MPSLCWRDFHIHTISNMPFICPVSADYLLSHMLIGTFCFLCSSSQGCTRGRHSNEKPQEPLQPEVTSEKGDVKQHSGKEIIYQGPKSAEALEKERPRYIEYICSSHTVCSVSHTNSLL